MSAIVADSSVLVAILRKEPDADTFLQVMSGASRCLLSAASLLETSIVIAGRDGTAQAWTRLDKLMEDSAIEVVPLDAPMARLARTAFLRYGKGRHPAALNFGDCASYALAKSSNLPLLYKGNDFTKTDLRSVT